MRKMNGMAILLLAGTLTGCGGGEAPEAETGAAGAAEPAGTGGAMEGMQGMGGMKMGGGAMDEMRAHMQAMEGKTGEQYKANLPQHRQTVANMIAQMNREMRDMNMTADQEWNSTIETLREDLRRLPDMSPVELETFMPEHRQRVMRLMEMHQGMMAGMSM